jgi:hypothetical protein
MPYAQGTKVPVSQSRLEIERVLLKYGADKFMYGTSPQGSGIMFEYKKIPIQLAVPNPDTRIFTSQASYDREQRRMWRVLLISLKSQLEKIDCGLSSFEDEFLAQTQLPSGQTVAQWMKPQIKHIIESGEMPKMLIAGQLEQSG